MSASAISSKSTDRPGRGHGRSAASVRSAPIARIDRSRLRMLADLCHRRWALPILAELNREIRPGGGGGAKFVTLANRLRLSRQTLRDTLDALIANDYLMRNPGMGHPMRPEYMLTEDGHQIAPHAAMIIAQLQRSGLEDVALRKWSLPVLQAIDGGLHRFSAMREALPDITSRALTLALKDLEQERLVIRRVTADYPPGVSYRLSRSGRRLARLVSALNAAQADDRP